MQKRTQRICFAAAIWTLHIYSAYRLYARSQHRKHYRYWDIPLSRADMHIVPDFMQSHEDAVYIRG